MKQSVTQIGEEVSIAMERLGRLEEGESLTAGHEAISSPKTVLASSSKPRRKRWRCLRMNLNPCVVPMNIRDYDRLIREVTNLSNWMNASA